MSKKNKKNRGNGSVKEEIKKEEIKEEVKMETKDQLTEGAKSENDKKEVEKESKIEITSVKEESLEAETEIENQATILQLDEKAETQKMVKNLISAVVLLAGVAIGSFFVDIVQFVSGDGFSKKALNNSEVLVTDDRTWVAFNQPAVDVKVLTVGEDKMKDCANCDPTEVLVWLRDYIPTMVVKNVDVDSEEGEAMIEAYNIKSLPAFIFSNDIEGTKFFQGEGSVVFTEIDDSFMLNAAGLGIPVGKYLQTPEVDETDAILGNKDAKVKVIVFSDFQCPYCEEHFNNAREAVAAFDQNDVALIYKDLPLNFHLQAQNAAMATRCAQDQGKFWEMGELLYKSQSEWQDTEGVASFKKYARNLNLDANRFNKCIDEGSFSDLIEKDLNQASEIGVSGAPATFIGTQFSSGVTPIMDLEEMIQTELDKDSEAAESVEIQTEEEQEDGQESEQIDEEMVL